MSFIDDDGASENALDMASIDAEIVAGARAFTKLLTHATDDWTSWSITIIGLRALRNLVFAEAHISDVRSYAYRQKIGELLEKKKYSALAQVDKQTRSTAYKLMDHIEQISTWYATLAPSDQMRWKHPDAIAKHCPKNFVAGGKGGNKPKQGKKKPLIDFEIERLRALLILVIKRLIRHEPDAAELLDQVTPQDPDDALDDLYGNDRDDEGAP
jgi:hypothetical protein